MKITIINGPNMRVVKYRKGYNSSYDEIVERVQHYCSMHDVTAEFFVSDIEGDIVKAIYSCRSDGIVINAAAYTHYSIAIRDALEIYSGHKIEVHMTNVHAREQFRHYSVIASVCDGTIAGFGVDSYILAVQALLYKSKL